MIHRMLDHVHGNAVAYLALLFSVIGGGGGYAVAATTHHGPARHTKQTAIVACASKRSGELFLHTRGKCAKGRKKVTWAVKGPKGSRGVKGRAGGAGVAGAPAPSIFAAVDADAAVGGLQTPAERGMVVSRSGVGSYAATITDAVCSQSDNNVPVVTPAVRFASGQAVPPAGVVPVAFIDDNTGISTQFTIHVGYVSSAGTFVPQDFYFDVQDTCLPASSPAGAAN